MENLEENQEAVSIIEPPQLPDLPVKQSKFTKLHATIKAKSVLHQIEKPGPFGPFVVHRVRNEGTEKDLPPGKWCNGQLLLRTEQGTVLDGGVTCTDCKQVILDRIAAQKAAQIQDDPGPEPTPGPEGQGDQMLNEIHRFRAESLKLQEREVVALETIVSHMGYIASIIEVAKN